PRVVRLLVVPALLGVHSTAQAEPPRVRFEWQRPFTSTCPPRRVLEADVEALVGRSLFTTRSDAELVVRGEIHEHATGGVQVHIEATHRDGQALGARDLHAPSGRCASLRDAIALVLTLFVEHRGASNDAESTEPAWRLGAVAGLGSTPLPGLSLSLGPTASLAFAPALEVRAIAAYWLPNMTQTVREVGASLEALSLDLQACTSLWRGLGVCTGVAAGAMFASPRGVDGPGRQVRLLSVGTALVRWQSWFADVGVELAAGPALSFSRPRLSFRDVDGQRVTVHRPPLLGIKLHVGLIMQVE
ncbi:MAG: hypothetical protein OXU20_38955, partial [Myxococcales bacterium]|nr:hypothetical protein [Myxococcales bacterium]